MKLKILYLFILLSTIFCLAEIELKDLNSSKSFSIYYSIQRYFFTLLLDLDSPYTWIPSINNPNTNIKNKLDEKTYGVNILGKDIILSYDNKELKVVNAQTKVTIAKKDFYAFPILLATDSKDFGNTPGIFGLGYPYSEVSKKYSILHNLVKAKGIKKKIFTIEYEKTGNLLIGETPRDIKSNLLSNCSFDMEMAKKGHLYCRTKSMIFGKYYFKDKRVDFNEESNLIGFDFKTPQTIFPFELFSKISEEIFSSLIDSKECTFGINNNINLYEITCNKNDYKEIKDLTIVINDFGLFFPKNELFSYDSKISSYIFKIHSKIDQKIIKLSFDILRNYKIIFDLEEDKTSFYNKNKVIKIAKNSEEEEEMIKEDEKRKEEEEEKKRKKEEDEEEKRKERKRKQEEEKQRRKQEEEEDEKRKQEEEEERRKKEEKEEKKRQEEIENKRKKEEEERNIKGVENKKTYSKIWTVIIIILILVAGYFIFSYLRKRKRSSKRSILNFENTNEELYSDIQRIKY